MNYWGYRVSTDHLDYFRSELEQGRLRQGWGWDENQNLKNFKLDQGAGRNRPMLKNVKKSNILLVPQLPNWGEVAIVQATENWDEGYSFKIDENLKDFGHVFPAQFLKSFTRGNQYVTGNLRSTLKNISRFWNISHFKADIDLLLSKDKTELIDSQANKSRLRTSVGSVFSEVFSESDFRQKLYSKLTEQFTREEWEYALVEGLTRLFPFYQIERVGGITEKFHGTDILIKLPSIVSNYQYAIAIQIKDYKGFVGTDVIAQINKAEQYWSSENLKLIEKIVIIVEAEKSDNTHLVEYDKSVKFIFANELKQILSEIGKSYFGAR